MLAALNEALGGLQAGGVAVEHVRLWGKVAEILAPWFARLDEPEVKSKCEGFMVMAAAGFHARAANGHQRLQVRAAMFVAWRRLVLAWKPHLSMTGGASCRGAGRRLLLLLMPLQDLWDAAAHDSAKALLQAKDVHAAAAEPFACPM